MGIATHTDISVDLNEQRYIIVNVKQYDNGLRHILVQCTNSGIPIRIEKDTMYAVFKLRKPDNRIVVQSCDILDDGRVDITINGEATKKAGRCFGEIVLYQKDSSEVEAPDELENLPSTGSIATMEICINIFPASIQDPDIESKDDFSAFNTLMSKVLRDYIWILNESKGLIGSVKSINGRLPDEEGAFVFNADDYQVIIDQALKTAKESGEFDGKDGVDGKDGKTPEKFVDYFTEEDLVTKNIPKSVCGVEPGEGRNIQLSASDVGAIPADKESEFVKNEDLGSFDKDIDLSGHTITNVTDPVNESDAANKRYVDEYVSKIVNVYSSIIQSDNWSDGSPATASIVVRGVQASHTPHITPMFTTSDLSQFRKEQYAWGMICKAVAGTDMITFYSFDGIPNVNIPIKIEVIG